MVDVPPNGAPAQTLPTATHEPFPVGRLLYALGFGVVAWFVLWLVFVLAIVQFIVLAVNGQTNGELKAFSLNLVHYLVELFAFILFVREERPFPFGPFPNRAA